MSTNPDYRRAGELYKQGRLSEAADLLERLVSADPGGLDARHALAVCRTDLGDTAAAREQLEEVVRRDPERRADTYRLAVLLQSTDAPGAAALYRRLLAAGPYRDAEQRLAACSAAPVRTERGGRVPTTTAVIRAPVDTVVTGHHPWTPDPVQEAVLAGPDSIRTVIETAGTTSRGQPVKTLRQLPRYRLPAMLRGLGIVGLVLAAAALLVAAGQLPADWLATAGRPADVRLVLDRLATVSALAAVLSALGVLGWQLLAARLYALTLYTRGLELASGLIPRRRTFVWYANVTVDADYVRSSAWSYLTRTASLELTCDTGSGGPLSMTLEGVGDPATILQLRAYLEQRRLAERVGLKNTFAT